MEPYRKEGPAVMETNTEGKRGRVARVELVDNWSSRWNEALKLLEDLGQAEVLRLDEAGWLPARRNLLVAFAGADAAGYMCFRVEPLVRQGSVVRRDGRTLLEAVVEGSGVTGNADADIPRQLREAAMHRALDLQCARFRWERVEAGV